MESLKSYNNSNIKTLKIEYQESLKNPLFKELVTKLKISDKEGCFNNSLFMDCVLELTNCKNCEGLYNCPNKVKGHYLYPKKDGAIIDVCYVKCDKQIKEEELLNKRWNASKELDAARFKDIDVTDKNRVTLIKWIKEFYDNYDKTKEARGLYLHGVFGSGKTYLIYALLNELKEKKHVEFIAVYYPDALKELKEDWDLFNEKMNKYFNVPILFLDDIGAESVSEWGRDEVLGTILQYRMNNHLTTFFTSNLTMEELEYHLALTKSSIDKVKARRIIERIKQLTIDMELIAENKRR